MKIKTSELQGAALDWAVEYALLSHVANAEMRYSVASMRQRTTGVGYSTNWAIGGPLIEREEINLICPKGGDFWDARESGLTAALEGKYYKGKTPLEAAMRCYVASELGNEVDIPDELTELGETK
jgi:hypothetical protein